MKDRTASLPNSCGEAAASVSTGVTKADGALVVRVTDRLHEPFRECRAFRSARRHHRFDLSRIPAWGFTPAGHRQVQFELDWRSLCAHETSGLLALSFNPLRGPFGPSSDCSDHYALC